MKHKERIKKLREEINNLIKSIKGKNKEITFLEREIDKVPNYIIVRFKIKKRIIKEVKNE